MDVLHHDRVGVLDVLKHPNHAPVLDLFEQGKLLQQQLQGIGFGIVSEGLDGDNAPARRLRPSSRHLTHGQKHGPIPTLPQFANDLVTANGLGHGVPS